MRTVDISVLAEATITELWRVEVPENTSKEKLVEEAFARVLEGNATFLEQTAVDNEHDRQPGTIEWDITQ